MTMLRKTATLYMGAAQPSSDNGGSGGSGEVTKQEFLTLSAQVTQNENDIATLQNDRDELGDQVQAIQADVTTLKSTSVTKNYVDTQLATKADSDTIDDVFTEIEVLRDGKLDKKLNASNAGKWLKVDAQGNIVPDNLPASGGGSVSDKYGIQADYAIHHGILDCPNGLIEYSVNTKEIEIQPGVVLQAAGAPMRTTIASKTTYNVEQTGDVVLFFTRTESEAGTIQTGFLEAGDVFYQEEEPTDGASSYLAWYNPTVGLWQFKSDQTGNVWRTAVATPIANIRAGSTGITSINYIGYRIIDDDVFVQQSEIESINETIQTINGNVSALDSQVNDLYTKVENTETWIFTLEDGTEVTKTIVLGA